MSDEKSPDQIDIHVGRRIRLLRRQRRMSQQELADAAGISFQQIQKYENATNRVSASRLWKIATALSVSISALYEGLANEPRGDVPEDLGRRRFLNSHHGMMMIDAASALPPKIVTSFAMLMQDTAKVFSGDDAKKVA